MLLQPCHLKNFLHNLPRKRKSISKNLILMLLIFSTICIYGSRAIQELSCYHNKGHEAACQYDDAYFMLLFGAVQVVILANHLLVS